MLFNLRKLAFFSRGKPLLRVDKKKNSAESRVTFKNPYGIDLDKFDVLDGLSNITLKDSDKESLWINNLKNLYEDNDHKSLEQLRNRQESIIKQIDAIRNIESKLPNLFVLKMSFNAKFRKWEEILVDCDNSIKLIKDPNYENQSEQEFLRLYNRKCIGCIMNSHDSLHNFLKFKNNKLLKRVKRGKVQKTEEKDIGLFLYTSAEQRVELIQSSQSTYQLYFQTVLLQSIGLLVLGQREQALKRVSKLTGNNFSLQMKQQIFISIVISLSYQNNVKQPLPQGLQSKLGKISSINEIQAAQLSKCSLTAPQAEKILNQISISVHRKPISQLSKVELKKYGRVLCLIAENYYLEGAKEESLRLFQLLDKLEEATQIKMIVLFIKMGISFDSGNLEQTLAYFELYKKQEVDENNNIANRLFYDLNLINNDLLRINIYKLIVKVYKQLKVAEREEEIQEQCEAMETTLLAYTLKESTFTQEQLQEELITNWRFKAEVRIPYYFFDLKLQKHFKPNWDLDYSVS